MYRRFGMLAAFVFMFVLTGSALVPGSPAYATSADVTVAADDENGDKDDGKKDEEKEEPKKRMKTRPYADRLHSKTRKPGPPPAKPKYKPWNKVITKDHKKHEGLINIYTKQEEVLFELGEDDFDVPMLAIMSLSQGIGSNFLFGGLPVDNMMFDFHREKDHVQVRRLTTMFQSGGDEGLDHAIDLTYSESIVASLPIKTEKKGNVIVDVKKMYLSDMAGMSIWMGAVLQRPVRMDPKKGYFNYIKNYPENTEIDTRLTYSPASILGLNLPNVPDPRYIQIGVSYSIRKLPEDPMMPRLEDDRVGYFPTAHKDFSREGKESFFVNYADRWRLVKKDPDAALSEPVEPIVYYLDHTIPEKYRKYIGEGIELWQRAFEEAGFKNAIIAKNAPTAEEDPEYDPLDARYNTIRWNVSDSPMYGAIGPHHADPRTGEILDSDILFEHSMVANFGRWYRRMSSPRATLMEIDPNLKAFWMTEEELANEINLNDIPQLKGKAHMFCTLNDQMMMGGHFMRLAMLANGVIESPGGEMSDAYVGDALRFVAAHEVGHAIGLRHNFKSSGATPYSQINDKGLIDDIGMTGSVMDYPTANVARDSGDQGYYYTPTIGTYDQWAIKWGYSVVDGDDAMEQSKNLESLASQCNDKAHLYGTDEDTYPWGAMDPRSNINDLGDDPMQWAIDRMAICDELLMNGSLEDRVIPDGGNYVPLRSAVTGLLIQKYIASNIASKNVGGRYTERTHKGGDKDPLMTVPADEQRKAMEFIVSNGLNSTTYQLPSDLLSKLQDNKHWSWQNNPFQQGRRFDFPLALWVGAIQNAVLTNLMNPVLQSRVVDAGYESEDAYQLSEMYNSLTKAIWTDNAAPAGRTAAWDRNLQWLYTQRLITQVTTPFPFTPFDAVALSRLHLQRIKSTCESTLQRRLDDQTNAHLMETIARIDRALDAQRMTGF